MTTGFLDTYGDARRAFIGAAHQNGYGFYTYALHGHKAQDGNALGCDVAIRKGEDRRTVVVTTSSVHGVEGHAGSALQRHWMADDMSVPPFDMIHVHALNPYGFAYNHRSDAANIDVNRNFIPDFTLPEANPGYMRFADVFVPRKISLRSTAAVYATMAMQGKKNMQAILTRGQYDHPHGMFYGGRRKSWSRRTFEHIIDEHVQGYERIVHVDLHTGLGKTAGDLEIIYPGRKDDAGYQWARAVWPQEKVEAMDKDASTSVSAPVMGDSTNVWRLTDMTHKADVHAFAFEFATVSPLRVFFALQADFVTRAHGGDAQAAYQKMRDAFAPQDAAWEKAVRKNGTRAMRTLLQSLSA